MPDLSSKVITTVRRHDLLSAQDHVIVALSGGADSVALLHTLLLLKDTFSLKCISAVHIHHGLRGKEADRDAAFVKRVCDTVGVSLEIVYVDTRAEAKRCHESIEEAGRRLRYSVFAHIIESIPHSKIAVAHNANDQAETILFHCIRGTGISGLRGMPVRRDRIIRPLIDCTSDEIRAFCKQQNIEYVVDNTNENIVYSRNRIRHKILPQMEAVNPGVVNALLRLGSIASQEDAFMQRETDKIIMQSRLSDGYSVEALLSADPVLTNRALATVVWKDCAVHLEYKQIDRLVALLGDGGFLTLPTGILAKCDKQTLCFIKPRPLDGNITLTKVETSPSDVTFGKTRFLVKTLSYAEFLEKSKIHKNLFNFCIPYDMINNKLFLRSRSPSDFIRPQGRGCTKTLKKLYNEWHIPVEQRRRIPVLCDRDGVVAVLGYAVDERAAVITSHDVLWFQKI